MEQFRLPTILLATLGGLLWFGLHIPAILYGTEHTPLHVSYLTADEQSPINGALHVLQSKSILGLQNQHTLYYGPVFALIAVPAAVLDFAYRYVIGEISQPLDYKDVVVWHWGGILAWARGIAVLIGFLGIYACFTLFSTKTLNLTGDRRIPWLAASLLATNYLYFEYSGAFRHWIIMVVLLLWQFVVLVWILEKENHRRWLWVGQVLLTTAAFGISYLGLLYQVFWIPVLYTWWRERAWVYLREFGYHLIGVGGGLILMVLWHPYGFMRTFGLFRFAAGGAEAAPVVATGSALHTLLTSFGYYTQVIIINNAVLCGAILIWLLWCLRTKYLPQVRYLFFVPLFPAVANHMFFGFVAHTESRHMLPTIVCLLIALLIGYVQARPTSISSRAYWIVIAAIGIGLVQIGGFVRMMSYGPPERVLMLPQIHAWQEADPGTSILLVKNWPIGYVHTRVAYADYISRYNKSQYELWQHILTAEPPKDVVPINVYYKHYDESVTQEDMQHYDHVVIHHPPEVGPGIAPESPQDIFDLKPWTLGRFTDYQETYTILK